MEACPCCHGLKALRVIDFVEVAGLQLRTESFAFCCHCQGQGTIETELPPRPLPPHLLLHGEEGA